MPTATRDRWDSLIQFMVEKHWPNLNWRFIKAQMLAESNGRASVASPVGAVGLMQIMPATFDEAVPEEFRSRTREDPEASLATGIRYLRRQFDRFGEVLDPVERLKFSAAAYNCGRGYVNAAISSYCLRRPASFPVPGESLVWDAVKPQLAGALVAGRSPDFRQTWNYVDKVFATYRELSLSRRAWWGWHSRYVPPLRRAD